jgi:Secretion system C-terminal sorting domain
LPESEQIIIGGHAVQSGAIYQWINCDNGNMPMAGENSQNFTADASGNYAVIISVGNCSDTSICIYINIIGNKENTNANQIKIFPNPSKGVFNIELKTKAQITVTNFLGEEIILKNYSAGKQFINLQGQSNGLYFVKIESDGGQQIVKLVKGE